MAYRHHLPPRYHVIWCAGDGVDQTWTTNKADAVEKAKAATQLPGFKVCIAYDVFIKKTVAVEYPEPQPRFRPNAKTPRECLTGRLF